MNKYLIKRTLVLGIIILFIGAIITPSISGNVNNMNDIKNVTITDINNAIQTRQRDPYATSTTDWWPMFRHDPGNTGSTTSVAPNTNQLRWKETISDEIYFASPVISNDRLYISSGWWLYSRSEPPTLTDKSIFEAQDKTEILKELTTYKEEYYGGVYCLDADMGTELWNYPLYAPNNPLVVDNKVYTTDLGSYYSYGSSLYCLDGETGIPIWNKPLGGLVLSPTIGADNKIFLGCLDYYTYGGSLKCVDFDGNSLWTYPLPMYELIWFSAPAYQDGKVYFITVDLYSYYQGKLYCLDAETGQYLWYEPIFTFWFFLFNTPSPVCKDGKVFVSDANLYTYSSSLKCFDSDDGNLLWEYPFGGFTLNPGIPSVSQDSVFITFFDYYSYYNFLYRISTNGTLIWKALIPGYSYWLFPSSSPVCSANKVIVYSLDYYAYTSNIYCVEIENGNILWNYPLDDESLVSPSIADERVYMADFTGNIYAFEDALKINKISGGMLCAKAEIKNKGTSDLTNVTWAIDVDGGMFNMIKKHTEGNIPTLQVNKSKTVRALPVFGLGNVEIEVSVSMPGIITPIRKSLNGMVLGLIVIVKS